MYNKTHDFMMRDKLRGNGEKLKDGFVRVAALTPKIKVADCDYNTERIIELIKEASQKKASLVVFPEMCITGYTCGDLFLQETLLESAKRSLIKICNESLKYKNMLIFAGLPFEYNSKLYNVAAAINNGRILGLVPKNIFRIMVNFMRDDSLLRDLTSV